MSKEIIIDNKYKRKEKKGSGCSATIYRVEDKETGKNYAMKIFEEDVDFDNEKEILEILKERKVPNVVNKIGSGKEEMDLGNGPSEKKYLILEYMENGDLCQFIKIGPLKEIHAKLIFKKILITVQSMHKNGVYHRDLKTQNILLNSEFNPIISDFGFSTITKSNLKQFLGTFNYVAPEIYDLSYDGEKVDIFALGVILFNLVTGTYGFQNAVKKQKIVYNKYIFKIDPFYILIALKVHKIFWKYISTRIKEVSEEFKKLYVKIVAYEPRERPTIKQILEDEWMKEINNKSKKEIEELESEIRKDFLERKKIIEKSLTNKETTITTKDNNDNEIKGDTRGFSEDDIKDFESDILPKVFKEGKYIEYYNMIIGDLNPVKFMNNLTKKLRNEKKNKEREYDCEIEPSKYNLKFKATFKKRECENKEIQENIKKELEKLNLDEENEVNKEKKEEEQEEHEEQEEDDDNADDIFKKACSIKIELYDYGDKKHLLKYVRKKGGLDEFYDLLKYINNCVDDILN